MKRIVITGATGLVGSHLAPLLEGEAELHACRADLSRELQLQALPPQFDALVYLAQSRRFRDFPDAAGEVARVNALAPVELAEHALRCGATQFVYASTGGVYAPSAEPIAEDAPLADAGTMSFYAATKLAAERLLAPFAARLNLVIVRPFFIYGPGQDRSMLIPRLIESVKAGSAIRLAGTDGLRLNPIHALDAASALRAALTLEGSHLVNMAGPDIVSLRQLAMEIATYVEKDAQFEHEPAATPGDLIGDTRRMESLLVAPRIRLRDRMKELVE